VQLYIPQLAERITLLAPWEFTVYGEERNLGLLKNLVAQGVLSEADAVKGFSSSYASSKSPKTLDDVYYGNNNPVAKVVLPPGAVLSVNRIFIRQGSAEYNSVTFNLLSTPRHTWKRARFWAKLHDVNTIQIDEHAIVTKPPEKLGSLPVAMAI